MWNRGGREGIGLPAYKPGFSFLSNGLGPNMGGGEAGRGWEGRGRVIKEVVYYGVSNKNNPLIYPSLPSLLPCYILTPLFY